MRIGHAAHQPERDHRNADRQQEEQQRHTRARLRIGHLDLRAKNGGGPRKGGVRNSTKGDAHTRAATRHSLIEGVWTQHAVCSVVDVCNCAQLCTVKKAQLPASGSVPNRAAFAKRREQARLREANGALRVEHSNDESAKRNGRRAGRSVSCGAGKHSRRGSNAKHALSGMRLPMHARAQNRPSGGTPASWVQCKRIERLQVQSTCKQ
eukprot:1861836-Pleurochrysis_carterae.AAC.2